VAVKAKVFEYTGSLDRQGLIYAADEAPIDVPGQWTPEHLLLAAVARCTLKSLAFHARGARLSSAARMRSLVARRGEDDRYAVVELEVDFDVELDPEPEALGDLLARAERDCFVGNSLTVKPRYRWMVNGRSAEAAS
jgi:uncharacterized OsmC-like protein